MRGRDAREWIPYSPMAGPHIVKPHEMPIDVGTDAVYVRRGSISRG